MGRARGILASEEPFHQPPAPRKRRSMTASRRNAYTYIYIIDRFLCLEDLAEGATERMAYAVWYTHILSCIELCGFEDCSPYPFVYIYQPTLPSYQIFASNSLLPLTGISIVRPCGSFASYFYGPFASCCCCVPKQHQCIRRTGKKTCVGL